MNNEAINNQNNKRTNGFLRNKNRNYKKTQNNNYLKQETIEELNDNNDYITQKTPEEKNKQAIFYFLRQKTGRNFDEFFESLENYKITHKNLDIIHSNTHIINYCINHSPADTLEKVIKFSEEYIDWETYVKPKAIFISLFKNNDILNVVIDLYKNKFKMQFNSVEIDEILETSSKYVHATETLRNIMENIINKTKTTKEQKINFIKNCVISHNINLFRILLENQEYYNIIQSNYNDLGVKIYENIINSHKRNFSSKPTKIELPPTKTIIETKNEIKHEINQDTVKIETPIIQEVNLNRENKETTIKLKKRKILA